MVSRKLMTMVAICLFWAILVMAGCSSSNSGSEKEPTGEQQQQQPQQTIELKYATYQAPTHYRSEIDMEMFKRIEEQTNGQVKITPYWNATLVDTKQWYQETVKGTADIVKTSPGLEKERFPLNDAATYFSYGITEGEVLRGAWTELWDTVPGLAAEYKEVKPFIFTSPGQNYIHTVKKPVRTVEDIKGMTLRTATNADSTMVKALGATPVSMPISECYSALDKGIIDGVLTGADPLESFKFAEVTKYSTALPYWPTWEVTYVMNMDTWNSLPPDIQKIFEENGDWWETEYLSQLDQIVQHALDFAKEKGAEIIELPPAESEKIIAILEEIAKEKAAEADGQGQPGTKTLEEARKLVEKHTK